MRWDNRLAPPSVSSASGTPKSGTTYSHSNLTILSGFWSGTGNASGHFVNMSWNTATCFLPCSVHGKSMMSRPTIWNGLWTSMGFRGGRGCRPAPVTTTHSGHRAGHGLKCAIEPLNHTITFRVISCGILAHTSSMRWDNRLAPPSVSSASGTPKSGTTYSHSNLTILSGFWSGTGNASGHFVNMSWNTATCFLPCSVHGKSMMSRPTIWNGLWTSMGFRGGRGCRPAPVTTTHSGHVEPPCQGDMPIATFRKRLQHRSPPLETFSEKLERILHK